jgi:hypothetical protein
MPLSFLDILYPHARAHACLGSARCHAPLDLGEDRRPIGFGRWRGRHLVSLASVFRATYYARLIPDSSPLSSPIPYCSPPGPHFGGGDALFVMFPNTPNGMPPSLLFLCSRFFTILMWNPTSPCASLFIPSSRLSFSGYPPGS